MATNPNFTNRNDKFAEDKQYARVLWGERSVPLDIELAEMQKIIQSRMQAIGQAVMQDGFLNAPSLTYASGTLTVPAATLVMKGVPMVIPEAMTLSGVAGQTVFLCYYEKVVAYADAVKRGGNLSGGSTVADNGILDVGMGYETSRRVQSQFKLTTGVDPEALFMINIASVTAGGTVTDTRPKSAAKPGSTTDESIGFRAIDDTTLADGMPNTISKLFSQLGNMIKRITGKSSWFSPPIKSIESLAANPIPFGLTSGNGLALSVTLDAPLDTGRNPIIMIKLHTDMSALASLTVNGFGGYPIYSDSTTQVKAGVYKSQQLLTLSWEVLNACWIVLTNTAPTAGSITSAMIANHTPLTTGTAPVSNVAVSLQTFMNNVADRVIKITGKSDWTVNPATTLEALNTGSAKVNSRAVDTLLATTAVTPVTSFTPTAAKAGFLVAVHFRVVTGATNVTVNVTWGGVGSSQNNLLLNAQSCAVGTYSLVPLFILASNAEDIVVNVTASVANQVYVTASIMGV